MIESVSDYLSKIRLKHLSVSGEYRRGEESWKVMVSPGKPETPPLEFDRQKMFVDATSVIVSLRQPDDCLQLADENGLAFVPEPGDSISWTHGGIRVVKKVAERGNGPCWMFLFGNREIEIYLDKTR